MNNIKIQVNTLQGNTTEQLQANAIQQIQFTVADIIGCAGSLKYLISEEYEAKIDLHAYALGRIRVNSLKDLGKKLDRGIMLIKEVAQHLEFRLLSRQGTEKAQDVHYGIMLALKSLLHLPEDRIYEEAILLSQQPTNYTRRHQFMEFFEQVLEKSRSSNHDAVKLVQTLYDELKLVNENPVSITERKEIAILNLQPLTAENEIL
jgi:hypothetical protein